MPTKVDERAVESCSCSRFSFTWEDGTEIKLRSFISKFLGCFETTLVAKDISQYNIHWC